MLYKKYPKKTFYFLLILSVVITQTIFVSAEIRPTPPAPLTLSKKVEVPPQIKSQNWKHAINIKTQVINTHIGRDIFYRPGIEVDYDTYKKPLFIIRGMASIYKDSGHLWAGFLHLGFRTEVEKFPNVFFRLGIGPTFIWRQNWWNHFDDYEGNMFYGKKRKNGRFETAFLLYGGDIEIEWRRKDGPSIVYSLIPGYPVIISTSIGLRYHY